MEMNVQVIGVFEKLRVQDIRIPLYCKATVWGISTEKDDNLEHMNDKNAIAYRQYKNVSYLS